MGSGASCLHLRRKRSLRPVHSGSLQPDCHGLDSSHRKSPIPPPPPRKRTISNLTCTQNEAESLKSCERIVQPPTASHRHSDSDHSLVSTQEEEEEEAQPQEVTYKVYLDITTNCVSTAQPDNDINVQTKPDETGAIDGTVITHYTSNTLCVPQRRHSVSRTATTSVNQSAISALSSVGSVLSELSKSPDSMASRSFSASSSSSSDTSSISSTTTTDSCDSSTTTDEESETEESVVEEFSPISPGSSRSDHRNLDHDQATVQRAVYSSSMSPRDNDMHEQVTDTEAQLTMTEQQRLSLQRMFKSYSLYSPSDRPSPCTIILTSAGNEHCILSAQHADSEEHQLRGASEPSSHSVLCGLPRDDEVDEFQLESDDEQSDSLSAEHMQTENASSVSPPPLALHTLQHMMNASSCNSPLEYLSAHLLNIGNMFAGSPQTDEIVSSVYSAMSQSVLGDGSSPAYSRKVDVDEITKYLEEEHEFYATRALRGGCNQDAEYVD